MINRAHRVIVTNIDDDETFMDMEFDCRTDALAYVLHQHAEHTCEEISGAIEYASECIETLRVDCDEDGTIDVCINGVRVYRIALVANDVPTVDDIASRYVDLCNV